MSEYRVKAFISALDAKEDFLIDQDIRIERVDPDESNLVCKEMKGVPQLLLCRPMSTVIVSLKNTDLVGALIHAPHMIEEFLTVLKLLKTGTPELIASRYKAINKKDYSPKDDFGEQIILQMPPRHWGKTLEIEKSDIEEIQKLWKKFSKRKKKINGKIKLALNRFLEHYSKVSEEDRLIDLIMAFEILIGATGSKLAMRAACYLEKEAQKRKEVFQFLESSYSLRSGAIHTGKIDLKKSKIKGFSKPLEVCSKLEGYLRIMLRKVIFGTVGLPSAKEFDENFWK